MPESEVRDRLERIAGYNLYHQRAGQPNHCTTVRQLERALEGWGHDPGRAKRVGFVPPPSAFLNSLVRPPSPTVVTAEEDF